MHESAPNAGRVARRAGLAPFRSMHLREETARSLANRPGSAKLSVLTEVLREALSLMGADVEEAAGLAHRQAVDILKRIQHGGRDASL